MIRRTWIARLFARSPSSPSASAAPAQAGLLPVSVSVQPEAGNFRWTYSVVLPTDMKLAGRQLLHHLRLRRLHRRVRERDLAVPGRIARSGTGRVSASNVGPTPDR